MTLGIDVKPGHIYIAPAGTPPEAMMAELYNAFPQRYMLGISSKEDTLGTYNGLGGATTNVVRSDRNHTIMRVTGTDGRMSNSAVQGVEDHAKLAGDMLRNTRGLFDGPYRYTENGKETIEVNNARVYTALTEGEAQRNLNFALANLESYLHWINKGRAEAEKREADLKAAEERKRKEEEKRQREIAEAKARVEADKKRIENAALDLYNAAHKRGAYNGWPPFMGSAQKQKWINLALDADYIKRQQASSVSAVPFPYGTLLNSISANTIKASDLYPTVVPAGPRYGY